MKTRGSPAPEPKTVMGYFGWRLETDKELHDLWLSLEVLEQRLDKLTAAMRKGSPARKAKPSCGRTRRKSR